MKAWAGRVVNYSRSLCIPQRSVNTQQVKRVESICFIDEIPPFDRGPQNETVVKGSTVRLRCDPPRVVPAPLVYWERDGTILVPDDNLKQTGGELVIKTKRSHSGLYTCVATWQSKSKTTRSRSGKLTVIPKGDRNLRHNDCNDYPYDPSLF